MLKKLLKHEFRATARTYGGLYLALLAVSVLFGASIRGWNGTNSDVYSTAVGLLSLAYTAVLIGTAVVTVMTIVRRFYSNLLGREGYLMHTLPVTEAQLVGAKLISGTVWSVCSIFAAGLSFGILAILMMADSVEAASRSLPEYTEESINNLVEKIIDSQVEEGFFKECPITFKDIAIVKSVFKEKLKTIYHTRISYPELKK